MTKNDKMVSLVKEPIGAPAKSRLFDLYSGDGYVYAFLRVRWWIADFEGVAKYVPESGTIVDLGCGYGIFANYIAAASPDRNVIGIELSGRKLKYADKGLPNARFINDDITRVADLPPCDCILLLDVLHHLNSFEEQESLLRYCKGLLRPNGMILIKDIDKKPLHKFLFTRMVDNLLYPTCSYYYREENDFKALLGRLGFDVEFHAIAGTPYSNAAYLARNRA